MSSTPFLRASRSRAILVLAAVVASTTLAACSSSSSTSGGDHGSGSQARAVTIAIPATVTSLDPGLASGSKNTLTVARELYSSLTRFDHDGKLVGDLATSWKQDGAHAWTFTLRSGAKFQNGEALDASTVAWNFDRAKQDAKLVAVSKIVSAVSQVQVVSPTEVRFVTGDQTYLNFPGLTSGWLFLPQKWTASHDPNTEADASGPYTLTSFTANQAVALKANPTYYGTKPALTNVTYKVFADQSALIAGLLGGSVDVAEGLDPNELKQIKATGKFAVGGVPGYRVQYLGINTSKEPWDNPLVREAATLAINRELITKTVLAGYTVPSHRQLFSSTFNGYQPDLTAWPYDPAKAKQLLEEAGAVGADAQISLASYQYAGSQQAAQVIASELNAVGFKASVQVLPIAQWSTKKAKDSTAAVFTYNGEASPSNSSAEVLSHFESEVIFPTSNVRGPQDKTLDDAIVKAWTAGTLSEQATYVKQATDRIDSTYRFIDLWPQPQTYAANTKLSFSPRSDDLDPAYEIGWAK